MSLKRAAILIVVAGKSGAAAKFAPFWLRPRLWLLPDCRRFLDRQLTAFPPSVALELSG